MTYFVPRNSRSLGVTQAASTSGKQCPSFLCIKAGYCIESAGGDRESRIEKERRCVDSSFITQEWEPHMLLVHANCDHEFQHCHCVLSDPHSCHTIKPQSTYHMARRYAPLFRTDTLGCQMRKRIVINLSPAFVLKARTTKPPLKAGGKYAHTSQALLI